MNDFNLNDEYSIALHLIEKLDIILYNESFYYYTGTHYAVFKKKRVRKEILKILKSNYTQRKVTNILDIIGLECLKEASEVNMNSTKNWINVKNGMYSLFDKKLIPHSDETKALCSINLFPITYNLSAKCPGWLKYLEGVFKPDQDKNEKILLLQEYMGLCLTPIIKFQKSLVLLGGGANGKSKAIAVLENIIGGINYSSVELHQLEHKNYIVHIHKKLVNFCSEIDHKGKFHSGVFKRIVTGDTVMGDEKYEKAFQFKPYCKLLFAANILPVTNDTSKGYFRRFMILKFNRRFEGKDDNKNLESELLLELDGIFNWMLLGLERLLNNNKFTIPPSSEEELEEYLTNSNSVVSFVKECCEIKVDEATWEKYDEFYTNYKTYCQNSGLKPFSKRNFRQEIEKNYDDKIVFKKTGSRDWHFKYVQFKGII